jgi:hypothetical protein
LPGQIFLKQIPNFRLIIDDEDVPIAHVGRSRRHPSGSFWQQLIKSTLTPMAGFGA